MDNQFEQEIRDCFARMGVELAYPDEFNSNKTWVAVSQYGYRIGENFDTRDDAEVFVINYYSDKMNLIRQ